MIGHFVGKALVVTVLFPVVSVLERTAFATRVLEIHYRVLAV